MFGIILRENQCYFYCRMPEKSTVPVRQKWGYAYKSINHQPEFFNVKAKVKSRFV